MTSPADSAQTLDRGLRLLHLVAETPGLTVTEAAQRLGLGRTVIYRLIGPLMSHAMIRRDSAGRLRLGVGLVQLARRARPLIADAARPALRRLAEEVGATAHFTVADDNDAIALVVVEPSWTSIHVAYRSGTRHPLERGAAGLAILAGRRGSAGPVSSAGELQAEAYGVAAPVLGVEGLEASVGVVALGTLEPMAVGPAVQTAANAVAAALA